MDGNFVISQRNEYELEKNWHKVAGSALGIDCDGSGNAWVVNKQGKIFHHDGRAWKPVAGKAWDIGINESGQVWVIGANKEAGGFGIYKYLGKNKWKKIPGSAIRIAVAPDGNAWVVNKQKHIY